MTIDETIENLKRLFDNCKLSMPCTDSLNILTSTIMMLDELKDLRNCVKSSAFVDGYTKGINDLIRAGFDHYLDTDNKVHDVVVDMQTMAEIGKKLIENVAKN